MFPLKGLSACIFHIITNENFTEIFMVTVYTSCAVFQAQNLTAFSYVPDVYTLTQVGNSALMLAVSTGFMDVVMELIKSGANLNLQNNVYSYSYLSYSH